MTDRTQLECPVFRPTLDDVRNLTFEQYVESVEPQWGPVGVCKIIAPEGWTPRRAGYDDLDGVLLPRPIRQHATGRQGLYRTLLMEQRSMRLGDFKELTQDPANRPPEGEPEALERKFWKNVPMNPPLYGADVPGTLFDERTRGWNLKRLSTLLSRTLEGAGAAIPGVTNPYLYAGSWRSFFAWHTEDLDLHSVNYLHAGAPKTWYVVPPAARDRFELMVRDLLPELARCCPEFLRHKEILLSPALLAAHNIPVVRLVHREREFVVVGPGAYHAGFNHGFNLAESVNFATLAWVPVGARASFCTCRPDSVKIDMRLFLEHMDAELAEEVLDSYRSDSDSDSEGAGGSGDSSEDEDEEQQSEQENEEASEAEEEAPAAAAPKRRKPAGAAAAAAARLPQKRTRRPSAKALAGGLLLAVEDILPPPPRRTTKNSAAPVAARRLAPKAAARRPTASARSKLLQQRRRQQQQQQEQQRRSAAAASRKRSRRTLRRDSSEERGGGFEGALPAAAAVAHIHASSDDDSAGAAAGGVPLRSTSKRGAAHAWYRMFDSLLPTLKRARA